MRRICILLLALHGIALQASTARCELWAVGGSVMMHSRDDGATWDITYPSPWWWTDVYFYNNTSGYAVGITGSTYRTSDGGSSWQYDQVSNYDLQSVHFVSASTGWAVGGDIIAKTTDGGNTWTINYPAPWFMNSVFFTDSQDGWAVGTTGAILRTIDGGLTWTSSHPTVYDLKEVFFVDRTTGWVVGDGIILRTTDAGAHWSADYTSPWSLHSVYFVDGQKGWAVGTEGVILKTVDGGVTWTSSFCSPYTLKSVCFRDALHGWAVGGNAVVQTDDGGISWTPHYPVTSYSLESICYLAPRPILVLPNGAGDYPTIQAALDAAEDGSIIELANGTFGGEGNHNVWNWSDKAGIIIRSKGGDPDSCIIDCGGYSMEDRYAIQNVYGVEGITIRNGYVGSGAMHGAVHQVTNVRKCTFANNYGEVAGASSGCRSFEDCLFVNNSGTAIVVGPPGTDVAHCRFVDNARGAIWCDGSDGTYALNVGYCVFDGNAVSWAGGAISANIQGALRVWNSTFVDNAALRGSSISFCVLEQGCSFEMTECIVAGGSGGCAVDIFAFDGQPELTCTMTCNDIFGNEGGDWVGYIEGELGQHSNVCLNPLFCGSGEYRYHVQGGSPCAPSGNESGCLMGACGVGCSNTVSVPAAPYLPPGRTGHSLSQNVPNPFNPTTLMAFNLPVREAVTIRVFDASGRLVRCLFDGEAAAGVNEIGWNGTNDRGQRMASGVYFCRMEAGSFRETRRMTLVK